MPRTSRFGDTWGKNAIYENRSGFVFIPVWEENTEKTAINWRDSHYKLPLIFKIEDRFSQGC